LQHVLENRGSGYFPRRIVQPHLKAKRLSVVVGAPQYSMPAYVVYPLEYDRDLFGSELEIMHRMASPQTKKATGKRNAKRAAQKGR
jgi:DNA-binding transcriptional LysR family regulator